MDREKQAKVLSRFIRGLMAMLTICSAFYGCNKLESENTTIQIGAVLPLTGSAASLGKYCQQGIDLAVDEINAVQPTPLVRVVYEDSKADPKTAVAAAQKLISVDKTPAIICLTTGDTSAIAPICERSKVVLMTNTLAPGAADLGEYVFRNASNLQRDAEEVAALCVNKLRKGKVAIMALNVDALRNVAQAFKTKIESIGGSIVAVEYGEKGGTDFRSQLTKIKNAEPEAVYFCGYVETAYMMKQAKELGIDAQFLGDPGMESPKTVEIAGEAAEGVILTRAALDTSTTDKSAQEFIGKYKKRYDVEPEGFAAQSYDSLKLLVEAALQTGSNSDAMRSHLITVSHYPGASGDTTFLPNGDVEKPIAFGTVRNGQFTRYDISE
ncbi:MAG: ABC transporter substrate-binding protein [Candidatus Hydrogenedentales bacterium]|jgi:branched-chain amino acid transport system substrate-binding protein